MRLPFPQLFSLMLLAVSASAKAAFSDVVTLRGGARAYYSSAYISSTGSWKYDAPVLEQYFDLTLDAGPYGSLTTDAWLFSDVSGTCQDVHRRAFSCYEGTVTYGYEWALNDARTVRLKTSGGMLWDWLGGYKAKHETPMFYYAFQSLENPIVTPYWNALVGPFTDGRDWKRVRLGVRHAFGLTDTLTLTPFADTTWGDSERFRKNYGELPNHRIFGGAFMFGAIGVIAQWYFYDHWFLWGRYRQYFTLDPQARRLIRNRVNGPDATEYPLFSLGVGFRF